MPTYRGPLKAVRPLGRDQDDQLERVSEGESAQLASGDLSLKELTGFDRPRETSVRAALTRHAPPEWGRTARSF